MPGKELDAGKKFYAKLQEVSGSAGELSMGVFKGFGSWDLVLFTESDDYESLLSKAGVVDGLLSSAQFLAFPYMCESDNGKLFDKVIQDAFSSITLIKLDGNLENFLSDLRVKFNDNGVECLIFATIGWNEAIVISQNTPIDNITNVLLDISEFMTDDYSIRKTYTQFILNFEIFKHLDFKNKTRVDCVAEISRNVKQLSNMIADDIRIVVQISTNQLCFHKIIQYWQELGGYECFSVCGQQDVSVSIKKNSRVTWAQFIADLLIIRAKDEFDVYSTNTSFYKDIKKCNDVKIDKYCWNDNIYPIKYEEDIYRALSEFLSGEQLTRFVRLIYTHHSHARNPLLSDAFFSIGRAIKKFITDLRILHLKGDDITRAASILCDLLAQSLEVRTLGTELISSTSSTNASKFAGGIHKVIDALELLPNCIISRAINTEYQGFITPRSRIYGHFHDVIRVPDQDLLNPEKWWTLHHEIGHVIYKETDIAKLKDQLVVARIPGGIKLYEEIIAEVLGFTLGFFDNLELFDTLVWGYLAEISHVYEEGEFEVSFIHHLYRCYAVRVYNRLMGGGYDTDPRAMCVDFSEYVDKVINQHLLAKNSLSSSFKKYLLKINVVSFAVQRRQMLSEFVFPIIRAFCSENFDGIHADEVWLSHSNTRSVMESIRSGLVYREKILYPEAIIYILASEAQSCKIPFQQRIATILSLANCTRILMRENYVSTN